MIPGGGGGVEGIDVEVFIDEPVSVRISIIPRLLGGPALGLVKGVKGRAVI